MDVTKEDLQNAIDRSDMEADDWLGRPLKGRAERKSALC